MDQQAKKKRGRPKKVRPAPLDRTLGDPDMAGWSARDFEAAGIMSRRQMATCLLVGSIPHDEFERLIESSPVPTVTQLANLARRRAGKEPGGDAPTKLIDWPNVARLANEIAVRACSPDEKDRAGCLSRAREIVELLK